MPWQRDAVDVALEIDPDTNQFFYRTVVITVMRQQGKTTMTLPVWLHRCIRWNEQFAAWTMQTAKDAREKWAEEHVPLVRQSRFNRLIEGGVRVQSGTEHMKFKNGSMQTLMASQLESGHGKVVDIGMIDEAWGQPDDRLHQALSPAMVTRDQPGMPGPQLWILSTVGPVGAKAEWFHSWVDAGRAAVDNGTCELDRICYIEYSAHEDADPGDPETWWSSMPALGLTIQEGTVARAYREALLVPDGLAGFRRSKLNQRGTTEHDPPIPLALFDLCNAVSVAPHPEPAWAVDISPEQASASIACAWRRDDGAIQAQVVEHRSGTSWLNERVSELRARHGGAWVIDPRGANGSIAADWPGETLKAGEARAACSVLEAHIRDGTFGHYAQPELRKALSQAVKTANQDGGWGWARKSTLVDISPLVAVTNAVYAIHAGMRPNRGGFVMVL